MDRLFFFCHTMLPFPACCFLFFQMCHPPVVPFFVFTFSLVLFYISAFLSFISMLYTVFPSHYLVSFSPFSFCTLIFFLSLNIIISFLLIAYSLSFCMFQSLYLSLVFDPSITPCNTVWVLSCVPDVTLSFDSIDVHMCLYNLQFFPSYVAQYSPLSSLTSHAFVSFTLVSFSLH